MKLLHAELQFSAADTVMLLTHLPFSSISMVYIIRLKLVPFHVMWVKNLQVVTWHSVSAKQVSLIQYLVDNSISTRILFFMHAHKN